MPIYIALAVAKAQGRSQTVSTLLHVQAQAPEEARQHFERRLLQNDVHWEDEQGQPGLPLGKPYFKFLRELDTGVTSLGEQTQT